MGHKKKVKSTSKTQAVRKPLYPSDIEYIKLFEGCEIAKEHLAEVDKVIDTKLVPNRARYQMLSSMVNNISILGGVPDGWGLGANIFNSRSFLSGPSFQAPALLRDINTQPIGNAFTGSALNIGGVGNATKQTPSLFRDLNDINHVSGIISEPNNGISAQPLSTALGFSNNLFGKNGSSESFSLGSLGNTGFFFHSAFGPLPWYFIGLLHYMEANSDFKKHLHNGDPLTGYTVQVPAGRPKVGHGPPFTWEESAIDALKYEHLDGAKQWSLPIMLRKLESYNGNGYFKRHMASPYLWSFSNQYVKGKYVADRVFDPNAVSKQMGTAVILKRMEIRGLIYVPRN